MNLCYACLKLIVKAYLALLSQDCQVFGADRIPEGAKIIAANHPNYTDTFHLAFIIPEELHTLIMGNTISIPLFERLLALSGQIMVNPQHKGLSLQKACEYLGNGGTVLIYPEAQLNPTSQRLKGKAGAVRMSLSSGAPVIPLGIYVPAYCTRTIRNHKDGRMRQARWQTSGRCYLSFGEPWLASNEVHGNIDDPLIFALTDKLMGKIYDLTQNSYLRCLEDGSDQYPSSVGAASVDLAGRSNSYNRLL